MYMIVRPRGMVLVNKLDRSWLVSVRNAAVWDISFSVSCSTSRACLRTSLERNVSRQCLFLHTRRKQIPSTELCPPEKANTDEQRSHSALVDDKNVLTSSSRGSLCSVHQNSDGSYCVKTVLLIERHSGRKVIAVSLGLNFKSQESLSALEPVRSRSNVHPKISSLALLLRLCEEQIQYRRRTTFGIRVSTLRVHTEVPTTRAACEDHLRQHVPMTQLKIAASVYLWTFDVRIFRSAPRDEDMDSLSISRYGNIVVCSA